MANPRTSPLFVPRRPQELVAALRTLYARAPATTLTFASLAFSYLLTRARLSYALYMSLGGGGPLPHGIVGWALHTFLLRPLSMGVAYRKDPQYLPDDPHRKEVHALEDIPQREGERPFVFGLAPHRQVEGGKPGGNAAGRAKDGSAEEWNPWTEIVKHINELAAAHSDKLRTGTSKLEGGDSPALFSIPAASSRGLPSAGSPSVPSPLALSYLSATAGEFAHVHSFDSSLHVVLSPLDARRVLECGWGELHGLAGVLYGAHWLPPHLLRWLPVSAIKTPAWRWGKANGGYTGPPYRTAALPPTYTILYTPRSQEELEVVKRIIDAAVSFSSGVTVAEPYVL